MNKSIKTSGLVVAGIVLTSGLAFSATESADNFSFEDMGTAVEVRADMMKKNTNPSNIFFPGQENTANLEITCGEGKCGEGKCGSDTTKVKKDTTKNKGKTPEGKCGEGKCGSLDK